MNKLFNPTTGIGLDFLRNPMGASDLARSSYTYDDMPSGQTDPNLANFSIAHDLADVLPLTKQAQQLNPALKVMASPWTAPPWMKDNGAYSQGWLQSQYYAAYAQYFVKYIQAYQAQGVPIDYVSAQNEPTCCSGYPSMQWNGSGLDYFAGQRPAAGVPRRGPVAPRCSPCDWNWDTYDSYGAADRQRHRDAQRPELRRHRLARLRAATSSSRRTIHNQYPNVNAYDTEHSGGTWIANQQNEDMNNIIDYTRNWGKSVAKWSLAVDQNMGPHNGGCGTCTGLITVHNGDARSGQVDYNIEYYDMGQLTKFVKPGAYRIDSTANSSVPNVAWQNPDGSKALVAYNESRQRPDAEGRTGAASTSPTRCPPQTSATFTWSGTPGHRRWRRHRQTGQITGYGGKCVDVAGAQRGQRHRGPALRLQRHRRAAVDGRANGTIQALGKCMDVTSAGTANGTKVQLYDCNGTGAQQWQHQSERRAGQPQLPARCLDATGPSSANGTRLQIWDCTGGANQQWNLPS